MKKFLFLFLFCSLHLFAEDGLIWTKDKFSLLAGNPVCFSSDEKYVYATDGANLFKLNSQNGEQINFKKVISTNVIKAMVVLNDSVLAIGGARTYVTLCNANTGDTTHLIVMPNDGSSAVSCDKLALSKDNKKLVARYFDTGFNYALIDLEQNKLISALQDSKADYRDYCVNDDFTAMYVVQNTEIGPTYEHKIIKFSLPDFKPIDTLRLDNIYNTLLLSPIVLPDNKLAIASSIGKVFIIDVLQNNDLNQYAKFETIQIPKDVDQHIMWLIHYKSNSIVFINGSGNHFIYDLDQKKITKQIAINNILKSFSNDFSKGLGSRVSLYNMDILTGVAPSENPNIIQLYPNPTNNIINLNCNIQFPSNYVMRIINSNGVIVHNENLGILNIGQFSKIVNVSNLPNGTYFLKIEAPMNTINFKFVKGN